MGSTPTMHAVAGLASCRPARLADERGRHVLRAHLRGGAHAPRAATVPRAAACRRATAVQPRAAAHEPIDARPHRVERLQRQVERPVGACANSTIRGGHSVTHAFRLACARTKGAHHVRATDSSLAPSPAPLAARRWARSLRRACSCMRWAHAAGPWACASTIVSAAIWWPLVKIAFRQTTARGRPVVRQPVRRLLAVVRVVALEEHVQQVRLRLGRARLGDAGCDRVQVGAARELRRAPPPRRAPTQMKGCDWPKMQSCGEVIADARDRAARA